MEIGCRSDQNWWEPERVWVAFVRLIACAGMLLSAMPLFGQTAGAAATPRGSAGLYNRLVIYPAPAGEPLSTDYRVEVNGRPVPVYTARVNDPPLAHLDHGGTYSFVYFDFAGLATVTIHGLLPRQLQSAIIRPISKGIRHMLVDGFTTTVRLSEPARFSFEPEGRTHPLLVFANPLETDAPKEGDPNVVYFGPGVHSPEGGVIKLTSNQTLYIAGGAVVKAAVIVTDAENVKIRGRGILCANSWPWRKGPAPRFVGIRNSKNTSLEGIILRGSYSWTVVPENCDHVTITNLKICGGRAWNDDGINPCNTRHVLVKDCFIRTDDDCMAPKGLRMEWGDVDDVRVENTVMWCDRARIILLGHESLAKNMQNFTFRNIDIIHFVLTPFLFEVGDEMTLQNIRFEDVRIEGVGQDQLMIIRPVVNQYIRTGVPGYIRNIYFKNVHLAGDPRNTHLSGDPGAYKIYVSGYDQKYRTEGVTFENFTINGQPLVEDSPYLQIGEHTTGIRVVPPAAK
jgi:hypothetical protein